MTSSPLVIRCIRNFDNKDEDDVITIRPSSFYKGKLSFNITHTTTATSLKKKENTMSMNFNDTRNYIDMLFSVLSLDTEPFNGYQFDLPGIPPIIVDAKNLLTTRFYVMEYFHTLTNRNNWLLKDADGRVRVHEIYDDSGRVSRRITTPV